MSPKLTPAERRLHDPLSEVTRRERKFLLGLCAISYAIVQTRLLPSKISELAIEFSASNQEALLVVLAIIVGYFLLAFTIYAASDYTLWQVNFYLELKDFRETEIKTSGKKKSRELKRAVGKEMRRAKLYHFWLKVTSPVSAIRAIFEFLIPIIIGLYTIRLLLITKLP